MFQPVVLMVMIVGIGYIISKNVEITKQTRQFIAFTVVNFAVPSVIVSSIFQIEIDKRIWVNFAIIFICAVMLIFLGITMGYLAGRKFGYTAVESKQMSVLSGCGNTGFIGIPLIDMLLGPMGGVYASIYDSASVFTVFTIGIILLQGSKFNLRQLKSLLNAPFITLFLSLVIASTGLGIPSLLFNLSSMLSSLAAPLAMMYIGMLFQEITVEKREKIKNQYKAFIWSSSIVKTIIVPLMAFVLLILISVENGISKVIFIQASMPTLMIAPILFARYTGSEDLGIMNVILTCLLCLVTLPISMYVSLHLL